MSFQKWKLFNRLVFPNGKIREIYKRNIQNGQGSPFKQITTTKGVSKTRYLGSAMVVKKIIG